MELLVIIQKTERNDSMKLVIAEKPSVGMALAKVLGVKQAQVSSIKSERKTVNPPKLYDLTSLQRVS